MTSEPAPARDGDVPDAVLDELRQAFTGTPPAGAEQPDGVLVGAAANEPRTEPPIAPPGGVRSGDDGSIDLDDLPPAEFDDLSGGPAHVAPTSRPTIRIGDEFGEFGAFGGTQGPAGRSGAPLDATAAYDTTSPLDDDWDLDVPSAPTGSRELGARTTDTTGAADTADPEAAAVEPWVVEVPGSAGAGAAAAGHGVPTRPTIVIGGDDDLPDPVSLDEEAVSGAAAMPAGDGRPAGERGDTGDTGERGTIVIGDELEASGAFDAVAIPSRSMDPRVRARRIAVKRAQSRKRLLWVAGVGGVVIVVVAVLAVFSSSLFAVERVDVQGAPYTQARYADRLQAVIDRLEGEPVLLVDTRAAEEALEALPWIERAFVRTDFPNRVLIDVRERQPLATFQGSDGRYRVVDRDGFVLDVLEGRPASYMLVGGVGPDVEAGSSAGTPYAAAAQLVGALPTEIRDITVEASVDPSTIDLGLVIQRIPPPESEEGDGGDEGGDAGADQGSTGGGPTEPELVTVRIGSFNGLDGKLARLLQLVRDGLDDASPVDVSTDDVIG